MAFSRTGCEAYPAGDVYDAEFGVETNCADASLDLVAGADRHD